MTPISAFNVSTKQVSTSRTAAIKVEGFAYATAAAGLFVQIHNSPAAPANGAGASTTLVDSFPIYASGEFFKDYKLGELYCPNGIWIGISTTDATYTATAAGGDKMDVTVELYDPERPQGTTFATNGDLEAEGADVVFDGTTETKLYYLKFTNAEDTDFYIQIFAHESPMNGQRPLITKLLPKSSNGGSLVMDFGYAGWLPTENIANVPTHACVVCLSSTPETLTVVASQTVTFVYETKAV